jgi:chromosome segregation ATPase
VGALEAALREAGQTITDFEKAVDTARQRAVWLKQFDGLATATNRTAKLQSAIEAEEAKFDEMRQAMIARCDKVRAELAVVTANREAGERAKHELLNPASVPGTIGVKWREAVAAREQAEQAVEATQSELREASERVRSEERWIEQLTGGTVKTFTLPKLLKTDEDRSVPVDNSKVEEHRKALARAHRRKDEAEANLKAAEQAAAKAKKAVDDLTPEVVKA